LTDGYVVCPEKITSPHPDYGLPPNAPCGCKVAVVNPAPLMDFLCPRGHRFIAQPKDVHRANG